MSVKRFELEYLRRAPIRLRPKPMESFASYLTRTCQAYGYKSFTEFTRRFNLKGLTKKSINGYYKVNYQYLEYRFDLTREEIEAMCMTSVGKSLGYNLKQSVHVVKHVKSRHLRYCPLCLQEDCYYSLIWRFSHIPGCERHMCYLQEFCPVCLSELSVFPRKLRVGQCDECDHQLAKCDPITLSEGDQLITRLQSADIRFLLSAPKANHNFDIGNQFRIHRERMGISTSEISRLFKSTTTVLTAFENDSRSTDIEVMTLYLNCIGLTFRQLYDVTTDQIELSEIEQMCEAVRINLIEKADEFEAQLLIKVQEVVEYFMEENIIINNRNVTANLGLDANHIQVYPTVGKYIKDMRVIQHNIT